MRDGRSSRTAEHNALFRALEARHPASERPAVDDHARRFLSPGLRLVDASARPRLGHRLVTGFIDQRWPGVRSSVVARTRLIDDLICQLAGEVDQLVILGAGFDSRAHRLGCVGGITTIEVDHPATQARKRRRLASAATGDDHVRYAATDFLDGDLDGVLRGSGFDPTAASLFLWEGVTNYLSPDAVDATLRWCAGAGAGSHVVFTYVDRKVLDDPGSFHRADRVLATSRRAGEALTFGIAPAELPAHLDERGLRLISDVGAAGYRAAYYGPAADRIRGHEFYRVAHAAIGPPPPRPR